MFSHRRIFMSNPSTTKFPLKVRDSRDHSLLLLIGMVFLDFSSKLAVTEYLVQLLNCS